MRQVIVVLVDSVSDLITNSSTDIFACQTKMTEEAVRELLTNISTAADESAGCSVETMTLREFFEKIKWYAAYDLGIDVRNETKFEKESDNIFIEWMEKHHHRFGDSANEKTKIIVVAGNSDNSVPYWLQQFIEDKLNGLRYHLG